MAPYDPQGHWSSVGKQIRSRRDGNRLAGDDAPYYRYKGDLVRTQLLPRMPVEGLSVLDVGCGAGGSLDPLAERNPKRLAGCDQSVEMVKLAAENVPQAEIRLMDGQHLPYEDREFDLVKTVTVLQHNPDDRRSALIAEICRVARDYVVLFEDTATPRVSGNEGSGVYANYFGRPLDWYVDECKKHGWLLITSKSLATYVSHRTFNLLRGTLSRGRKEGQPLSPMHVAIERRTLPITRRLDRVVPSRQWELTMMMFRGTWREY